jgi:hypothetical protein
LTCIDSLLSYLDLRRPQLELLQQLGWRSGHLLKLILPQLLIPVALAALLAVTLAGGAVLLIYDTFPLPVWQPLLVAAAFTVLTVLLILGWMQTQVQKRLPGAGKETSPFKAVLITGMAAAVLIGAVVFILHFSPQVRTGEPPDEKSLAEKETIRVLGSKALELTLLGSARGRLNRENRLRQPSRWRRSPGALLRRPSGWIYQAHPVRAGRSGCSPTTGLSARGPRTMPAAPPGPLCWPGN